MKTITTDIAVIGAGGAGLRAAIAAAEANPDLEIALISKVYPMRSHTVAAEGGSAAVIKDEDSLDNHFNDTVGGGDWLCEQDVVEYFVENATREMTQLEQWGCPWSRKENGDVNVRRFGGMKVERTWFAADKTGFHMLHTLFQTSIKYKQINRFDEYFVVDLLVEDGQAQGLVAIHMSEGELICIKAKSVVLATGGAGRVYNCNTNGGIVTGDGMAMAFRHGVPLRDMEFVQYHPTGLPGTGILMTEGCRGEGGIMLNKNGYRYLQDYGMGPETPIGEPKNKYMELGPRDKVSQAFWHEQQKGNTIKHPLGDVVHLDLRHLGKEYLHERLPFICELSKAYVNVDPAEEPIPIRPTVHYTMGGIETDKNNETRIAGLFAVGECSSVGLHGANRLGSNSLAELVVFGRLAGEGAAKRAVEFKGWNEASITKQIQAVQDRIDALMSQEGDENWSDIRTEMGHSMEAGCGIYREESLMQATVDKLAELRERYKK
ncbi:fumarate reductase (quinol) flavoprotein subunit, partial [Photobacterium frigidiphilum]